MAMLLAIGHNHPVAFAPPFLEKEGSEDVVSPLLPEAADWLVAALALEYLRRATSAQKKRATRAL